MSTPSSVNIVRSRVDPSARNANRTFAMVTAIPSPWRQRTREEISFSWSAVEEGDAPVRVAAVDSSVSPEGLSDDALLARFSSGDDAAGRVFIRRFQGQVYGVALAILRDPVPAEDVAQETFVRAWKHGPTFDARRGTVAAWLLRITRNLAIDALRLRRADVMDPDVLAAVAPPSDVSVEDAGVTAATAADVRRALQSLPEEQRRALLLAAFYGRTAEEISRAEAIPLGTAKTRIRLGLRRIRGLLATPAEET
jgi:RNA polymerase sigma-70 factor (ECF subfamily)